MPWSRGTEDRLDLETLVSDLARQGRAAETTASVDALFERLIELARPGDVVVTMSSGSFAGLPRRLAEAFAAPARSEQGPGRPGAG